MPPEQKIETNAGKETATETVQRIESARNTPTVDNTTITPESLKPQAVIDVPEAPQANQLGAIADEAVAGAEDAFTQQQALASQQAEQTKDTSLEDYLASIRDAQGVAQLTQQASEEAGITGIEGELNDVNDKIRREQLSLRRATERIQESGGGLASGASAEIGNLQRESFAKQADLSLIQLAAQGKYDSAKAAVDRVVDAKLEQQKQFTDSLGVMYQDAKDTFTKAEQREFETLLGNRNRALSEEKEKQTAIYDLALQAQLDGAPTDIVQAMMASDSRDAAMAAGGSYIGRLDRQQKEASIRSSNASALNSELGAQLKQQEIEAITNVGNDPEEVTKSLEQFSFLRNTIADAQGLTSAAGPNLITQTAGNIFVGNTRVKQLQNKIETLKVNLLTVAGDPNVKEFFGPQMSDNDSRLMLSSGTTMDAYTNSEEDLAAELERYDDLMNRMETAVRQGSQGLSTTGTFMTAPDGTVIEIVD